MQSPFQTCDLDTTKELGLAPAGVSSACWFVWSVTGVCSPSFAFRRGRAVLSIMSSFLSGLWIKYAVLTHVACSYKNAMKKKKKIISLPGVAPTWESLPQTGDLVPLHRTARLSQMSLRATPGCFRQALFAGDKCYGLPPL